jgi:hypothetical protein
MVCASRLIFSSERFFKALVGRSDIEDALQRLDMLTQEEHRMATAQALRVTELRARVLIDGARLVSPNHDGHCLLTDFTARYRPHCETS